MDGGGRPGGWIVHHMNGFEHMDEACPWRPNSHESVSRRWTPAAGGKDESALLGGGSSQKKKYFTLTFANLG